jgi:hypothetical protein
MCAIAAAIDADSGGAGGAGTTAVATAAAMGREAAEEAAVGGARPLDTRARLAAGSMQSAALNPADKSNLKVFSTSGAASVGAGRSGGG